MDDPVARVRSYLARFSYDGEICEFDASTHTAEEAARAVGVAVGQIAKSILFSVNGRTVLVVTSGDVKVSQSKLKAHLGLGGRVEMPDAATTLELTGFPPGGVCPFALKKPIPVLIDVSMKRFPVVYAAAGSPRSAVPVTVDQLLAMTGGQLCDLS